MAFFKKSKELEEFNKRADELKILEALTEIDSLKRSLNEFKKKIEEKDKEIKKLNSKIDLLKATPINNVNDIKFINNDEGVGTYLRDVTVYDEIDLYDIGETYIGCEKRKVFRKKWQKGSITISLKVSNSNSSKKEIFNAINRTYPKLLKYFRE